jgi:hypothetical protein
MSFNPKEHLTNIKGKKYLGAKPRMQWFRDEHPTGRIVTDMINLEPPVVRAEIYDSDNVLLATGLGMAVDKGNTTWSGRAVEKAETAAIARALGHAGYADDSEHLADSPVKPQPKQQQHQTNNNKPVDWNQDIEQVTAFVNWCKEAMVEQP